MTAVVKCETRKTMAKELRDAETVFSRDDECVVDAVENRSLKRRILWPTRSVFFNFFQKSISYPISCISQSKPFGMNSIPCCCQSHEFK